MQFAVHDGNEYQRLSSEGSLLPPSPGYGETRTSAPTDFSKGRGHETLGAVVSAKDSQPPYVGSYGG